MITFTILYDEKSKQTNMMGNCTPQQAMQLIQQTIISNAIAKAEAKNKGNGGHIVAANKNDQPRLPL